MKRYPTGAAGVLMLGAKSAKGPMPMSMGDKKAGRFDIGSRDISHVYRTDSEESEVQYVTMKPCICCTPCECGFFDQTKFKGNYEQFPASVSALLAANGLTDHDLHAVVNDVHNEFARRTFCCWRLGLCPPLGLLYCWIDCNARMKLSNKLLFKPAIRAIAAILQRHNERLSEYGITVGIKSSDGAQAIMLNGAGLVGGVETLQLQSWMLTVQATGKKLILEES